MGTRGQLLRFILTRNAPLVGVSVYDHCPFVGVGNSEDRITTSGNVSSVNSDEVFISDERGGLISTCPPDLSVGHQFAKDLAGLSYADWSNPQ